MAFCLMIGLLTYNLWFSYLVWLRSCFSTIRRHGWIIVMLVMLISLNLVSLEQYMQAMSIFASYVDQQALSIFDSNELYCATFVLQVLQPAAFCYIQFIHVSKCCARAWTATAISGDTERSYNGKTVDLYLPCYGLWMVSSCKGIFYLIIFRHFPDLSYNFKICQHIEWPYISALSYT